MNIPTHVMTQLSIAKTGIAQIMLNNLRTCLTLFGANTLINPLPVYAGPTTVVVPPPMTPSLVRLKPGMSIDGMSTNALDPWYRYPYAAYAGRRLVNGTYLPDEYEYYWQKKQAERALKSARRKSIVAPGAVAGTTVVVPPPKAISNPSLMRASIFPPVVTTTNPAAYLPPATPYTIVQPPPLAPASRLGDASRLGAAAKLELNEKNQMIYDKQDEVQFLKGQLKRMEIVLQNKNFKVCISA